MAKTRELDLRVEVKNKVGDDFHFMCEISNLEGVRIVHKIDPMLRLSFEPDAIREHFEGDDNDPTEGLTDEQLIEVGQTALTDDGVYRAFHEALKWALKEVS